LLLCQSLGEILRQALVLRCELGTAREDYIFIWPVAGDEYDERTMESLDGQGQTILAGMYAGLQVERDGKVESSPRARCSSRQRRSRWKLSDVEQGTKGTR